MPINDSTYFIYVLLSLLSLLGIAVLIWQYKHNGKGIMYKYLGMLFGGLFLHWVGMLHMRYLFLIKSPNHIESLRSWWWNARNWVVLFVMGIIVAHLIVESFKRFQEIKRERRITEDEKITSITNGKQDDRKKQANG